MTIGKTLGAIVLAGTMALGMGGCAKRHLVIDQFDEHYHCEVKFSEDFKSDQTILYELREKVAIRYHEVHEHQEKVEHQFSYDFFEGDKKVGTLTLEPHTKILVQGSPQTVYRILGHYSKMQKCEQLLQEKERNP